MASNSSPNTHLQVLHFGSFNHVEKFGKIPFIIWNRLIIARLWYSSLLYCLSPLLFLSKCISSLFFYMVFGFSAKFPMHSMLPNIFSSKFTALASTRKGKNQFTISISYHAEYGQTFWKLSHNPAQFLGQTNKINFS